MGKSVTAMHEHLRQNLVAASLISLLAISPVYTLPSLSDTPRIGLFGVALASLLLAASSREAKTRHTKDVLQTLGLAIACIVAAAIPSAVFYWLYDPLTGVPTRAILIGVFLTSTSLGTIYYFFNRHKFLTLAEALGFFGFVMTVPSGAAAILLQG